MRWKRILKPRQCWKSLTVAQGLGVVSVMFVVVVIALAWMFIK